MGTEQGHEAAGGVAGFAEALRQMADLLESDSRAAYVAAGGEFFGALSALAFEDRLAVELGRVSRRSGLRWVAPRNMGGWLMVVSAFFRAVAALGCEGRAATVRASDREEGWTLGNAV